ncbi:hypothetical protein KMW28_24700 [Flammeovirga yaeyamensis]|uniref:Uncharacterized protein n=1 Tax=Flammeovirga yaeyamensis TaxID=367791 RepID=A0AAX1N950_9BACT|nr:hypothetical protein [Flammeovirga yaeyamensis]MBB3699512.1 hypothetical protein [Flammeovirga yaeyamensis]NMF35232.1 hypothetical protein [Flammeovirga yaeyamensis]QWG04094.1 hypothetical protein KMW28_24700 [Flammeovirga yaeyamensis]
MILRKYFIPFEKITYQTKLDPEEVIYRINKITVPEYGIRRSKLSDRRNNIIYEGSVIGNEFSIIRMMKNNNSSSPRIDGTVEENFGVTEIKIKISPDPMELIITLLWCGLFAFGFYPFFISNLLKDFFDSTVWQPFAILLISYGIIIGSFKSNYKLSKKQLSKLFEAEIKNKIR